MSLISKAFAPYKVFGRDNYQTLAQHALYRVAQFLLCGEGRDVPEIAIVFEVVLIEPLICRAVVRKGMIDRGVPKQIFRIIRFQRGLEIEKDSGVAVFAGCVVDFAHVGMPAGARVLWQELVRFSRNLNPEISPAALHRIVEVTKVVTRIARCIASYNQFAAPTYQLIQRQIFEVAAVR